MVQRDFIGYGKEGPAIKWPENARIAVNFMLNYEEGAELTPVNGDTHAEVDGGEFTPSIRPEGVRNLTMESLFEYGSRTGLWRLLRMFDKEQIPLTLFLNGFALRLNPQLCAYLGNSVHEIAGHGWRWIDYGAISKETEKEHIQQCIQTVTQLTGKRPEGWLTSRRSEHTRKLLAEIGGFLYDSDSYADDSPYFDDKQLVIPCSLDCNDYRYSTSPGFNCPEEFFNHLKNTFDCLYEEDRTGMMSIGIHPRFSGHPGRCVALQQFVNYIKDLPEVWIARRIDIAKYWQSMSQ